MDYQLIRSQRKTLSVSVGREQNIVVRAPMRLSVPRIEAFLKQHQGWIVQQLAVAEEKKRLREENTLTPEETQLLRQMAQEQLPGRIAYWAARMGVTPTGFRVTSATTRWGSCSAKNSLCFSWRLMRLPSALVELVVVHELCHILVKNHSADFYRLLEQTLPDCRERGRLLRARSWEF